MYILYSYSQVKSSVVATYSHSFDPNVVPPSVVGCDDGDPGVRPWEELLEVAMLPSVRVRVRVRVRDPRQVAEGSIDTEPGLSGTDSLTLNSSSSSQFDSRIERLVRLLTALISVFEILTQFNTLRF